MSKPVHGNPEHLEITRQIAELSGLLGMIPDQNQVLVNDPAGQDSMELSEWFDQARLTFFKLSVLVGRALDLDLQ